MLLSSIKPTFFLTSSLIPDHPFPCRGSIYEQAADDIFSGVDGRTVTVTQAEKQTEHRWNRASTVGDSGRYDKSVCNYEPLWQIISFAITGPAKLSDHPLTFSCTL